MKINNLRGDLTDVSARTEALVHFKQSLRNSLSSAAPGRCNTPQHGLLFLHLQGRADRFCTQLQAYEGRIELRVKAAMSDTHHGCKCAFLADLTCATTTPGGYQGGVIHAKSGGECNRFTYQVYTGKVISSIICPSGRRVGVKTRYREHIWGHGQLGMRTFGGNSGANTIGTNKSHQALHLLPPWHRKIAHRQDGS